MGEDNESLIDVLSDLLSDLPKDIADAFEKQTSISGKLDEIIALLRKRDTVLEKGMESPAPYYRQETRSSIFDIKVEELAGCSSVVFLGFPKKDVIHFLEDLGNTGLTINLDHINEPISNRSHLAALLTGSKENDYLVFNVRNVNWASVQPVLSDAMNFHCVNITIGKGPSANSIRLDLEKIHYIFFDMTDLYLPNNVKGDFDCCYLCESNED